MVVLSNVNKYYDDFKALDNISFEVKKGDIVGLLGPNGAGKTTSMRIITGFFTADSGLVEINGVNPVKEPLKARSMIGYLPENPLLYEELTIFEFLLFVANMKALKNAKSLVEAVLEKTALTERKNQLISALSRGYKQRVGFAAALLGDPSVLILDEPTSGLDPNQVLEMRKLIKNMAGEKTIIFSTHILPEVEELCENVILIDKGKVKALDSVKNLKTMSLNTISCIIKAENLLKAEEILKESAEVTSIIKNADSIEISIKKANARKDLIEKLLASGLYEFYTPGLSLEDVFHHLTLEDVKDDKPKTGEEQ